jgi:hypothetical protein
MNEDDAFDKGHHPFKADTRPLSIISWNQLMRLFRYIN